MLQTLQTIRLILTLLPLIIDTVKAIEAALPYTGAGKEKLALIRAAIESGYDIATDTVTDFEKIWPAIERTVTAVVSAFNRIGVFNK